MARQLPEPGDTVQWDHVWGEAEVLRKGAMAATSPRPAVVPQTGSGVVIRYSKNQQDLLVRDGLGKQWRVPNQHARLVQRAVQQDQLF